MALTDVNHRVNTNSLLYEYYLKVNLEGKSVLDYGCNKGNLRKSIPDSVSCTFTGIDVQQSFVTELQNKYPSDTFIYMNKYHPSYNPTGSKTHTLSDSTSATYDYIFAWNVFTHCSYEYTKSCLEEMRARLKSGGQIVFNLYSKEQLLHLSNKMTILHNINRLKNGTHTAISSFSDFNNYVYWENAENLIYDTVADDNVTKDSFFSAYNINWVDSQNADWTLRDNYDNRVYTFTTS